MFQKRTKYGKELLKNALICMLSLAFMLQMIAYGTMEVMAASPAEGPYQLANLSYSYTTLDGTSVMSTADGRPKLLIFFGAECGNCRYTINSICRNSTLFSNVDIIAAESERHSKDEVSAFKDTYGNDKVVFSYSEDGDNSSSLWDYARKLEMGNTISYPVIIYIDKNNKIQYGTTGVSDADTVAANLERYCTDDEDTSSGDGDTGNNDGNDNDDNGGSSNDGSTDNDSVSNSNSGNMSGSTLTVTPTKYNTLELSWDPVPDVKSYEVYYSTSPDSGFVPLKNVKKHFLKFTKANCGQTYYFKMRTCSKTGKTVTYSDFNWKGNGQTSLDGDVHVSVTKETYNSVTLKWSKVNGAAKYAVYVAVGDGKYELWGYQKGTKFIHKGLETGKTYRYKVRPVRDSFEGKDSNEVSAQPVLGSMSKLKVKSVGPDSLKLSWKKVPGTGYYVIYRSDRIDGDYETLCEVPGSATSYVDTGLNAASTYYYKICAVAGSCRSEGRPAGQTTKMLIK